MNGCLHNTVIINRYPNHILPALYSQKVMLPDLGQSLGFGTMVKCIGYIMTQLVTLKKTVLREPGIKPVSTLLKYSCSVGISKHETSLKPGYLRFPWTRHYVYNVYMTVARIYILFVWNLIFQINSVQSTAPTKAAVYSKICQLGSSEQEEGLARKPTCSTVESAKLMLKVWKRPVSRSCQCSIPSALFYCIMMIDQHTAV